MTKDEYREIFFKKVREKFGDKIDLSEVNYIDSQTDVKLLCHEHDKYGREHGEFCKTPSRLLFTKGCPKCSGSYKRTTQDFIDESNIVHNNFYIYTKTKFEKMSGQVVITCPIHGDFKQFAFVHLQGADCPECAKQKMRSNTEEFIEKARKVHGNEYDYHLTIYETNTTNVDIICPKHGLFKQTPATHLRGGGCPMCVSDKIRESKLLTKEKFIERARKKHGDTYIYDEVDYVDSNTEVCLICRKHGRFWQKPVKHMAGHGCIQCQYEMIGNIKRKSLEDFIKEANKVHNNYYIYSESEYENTHKDLKIICPKHGPFYQKPSNHLRGAGCPICNASHMEQKVCSFLSNLNIKYEVQKTFDWLKEKSNLFIDVYLPDYNIAIECQGEQHFKPIQHFGGEEKFEKNKIRDEKKKKLCESNGIRLIYLRYDEDNIIEHLKNELKSIL